LDFAADPIAWGAYSTPPVKKAASHQEEKREMREGKDYVKNKGEKGKINSPVLSFNYLGSN